MGKSGRKSAEERLGSPLPLRCSGPSPRSPGPQHPRFPYSPTTRPPHPKPAKPAQTARRAADNRRHNGRQGRPTARRRQRTTAAANGQEAKRRQGRVPEEILGNHSPAERGKGAAAQRTAAATPGHARGQGRGNRKHHHPKGGRTMQGPVTGAEEAGHHREWIPERTTQRSKGRAPQRDRGQRRALDHRQTATAPSARPVGAKGDAAAPSRLPGSGTAEG